MVSLIQSLLLFLASSTATATRLQQNSNSSDPPIAITRNGTYTGKTLPDLSEESFLGIPFAQAPRLQLAQSLNTTWEEPRPATEFGLVCPGFGTNVNMNWPVGEDCLNLNVVRPIGTGPDDKLPVLVWVYGGGYKQGANRDPEFNTSYMVETSTRIGLPAIVVSVNYRLSGFGFLGSHEVLDQGVANLAFRDVWKSLEWVQENIAGFGGDPGRVTLWGESAGAIVNTYLATAYGGQNSDLFHGAIIASGPWFGNGRSDFAKQQDIYDSVVEGTNCSSSTDTLQCLRELPLETLNATFYSLSEGGGYFPIIDNDFIQDSPLNLWNEKKVAPINILIGHNTDEGLSVATVNANTTTQLSETLQAAMSINATIAQELIDLYPLDAPNPPYSVNNSVDWISETAAVGLSAGTQTRRAYGILGDWVFIAGTRKSASEWNDVSRGHKAYSYRFDTAPTRFPLVLTEGLGVGFVTHGTDLSWQFRLPYISPTPYPPIPNVTAMQTESFVMQSAWLSFAATGDPNHHGLDWVPYWPSYDEEPVNFVFNATLEDSLNLHVEEDDYRVEAIEWYNERWSFMTAIGYEGDGSED